MGYILRTTSALDSSGTKYLEEKYFNDPVSSLIVAGSNYYKHSPDLIGLALPNYGFIDQVGFPEMESTGTAVSLGTTGGITYSLVDGSTTRIGTTTDPMDASKSCWIFRCNSGDLDQGGSGNKRSEIYFYRGGRIKSKQNYLVGISTYLPPALATTTDEQLFWQVHSDGWVANASPWLAFYVRNGTARVDVRHGVDASTSPLTQVTTIFSQPVKTAVWQHWVMLFRYSYEDYTTNFVQLYLNGTMVGNYTGKLGYYENGGASFWKSGIYHWTNAGNTWDASLPTRECWQKGPVILKDGAVSPAEMYDFLRLI